MSKPNASDGRQEVYTWDLYDFTVTDQFWAARIYDGRPGKDEEDLQKSRWVEELVRREKARRQQEQEAGAGVVGTR